MSKFLPNSNSITEFMSSLQNRVRALELNKSYIVQKRIQKAEDFGVIGDDGYVELRPNTLYVLDFEGTLLINFGLKIPSDGGIITLEGTLGGGSQQAIVCTNSSVSLFSGGVRTNFKLDALGFSHPTGDIFNISGGFVSPFVATTVLSILNCTFLTSEGMGDISNYYVFLTEKISIIGFDNGITLKGFFGVGYLANINAVNNNAGHTIITFDSTYVTFGRFQFFSNSFSIGTDVTNTAIEVISGATIPNDGIGLLTCSFAGDGTYLEGITPSDVRFYSKDNFEPSTKNPREVFNSIIAGGYYVSTATATTIAVTNTWYKVLGTTTATSTERFSHSNNRLTYLGNNTQKLLINFSGNFIDGAGTPIAQIAIAKNGSIETPTIMRVDLKHSGGADNVSISAILTLDRDDYLEVFIRNTTNTNNITCNFGQMTVIGLT
jgi:hypothetical protein